METLDDITTREQARLEKAWAYQKAVSERDRLQQLMTRLPPKLDHVDRSLDLLTQIDALAAQLPDDVIGALSYQCGPQIRGACLAARTSQTKRRTAIQRDLDQAREALPRQEALLAEII